MTKLRTSAIVAVSMAIGIVGGAAVTAIADQPNMRSALDHLVASGRVTAATADFQPFRDAVPYGVSANLCEALVGLHASCAARQP